MEVREYDVVCIGGGGAGASAAITAAEAGARVLLISKEPIGYGNTRIAGGRQAACGIVPEDDPEVFYNDLVAGGEHLNNPKIARAVAEEARTAAAMAESYGQIFRRDAEGGIGRGVVTRGGGHSFARTVTIAGKGVAMGQVLRAAAARHHLDLREEAIVVRLLRESGRIAGLVAWDMAAGEPLVVRAPAVIIATGGLGWLYYPHTTCQRGSTGDGLTLAYEAGAELADMEQVQFAPFGCTHPTSMVGVAIGDQTWAGPKGRLLDGRGREIIAGINRMTRAQVSRIMGQELRKGNGTRYGGLLLDLRPNLDTPNGRAIWERMRDEHLLDVPLRAYGPKAFAWEEPWDVAPSAHFSMGGLRIDEHGATSVPGLFAAGEAAAGVHGGDRLGSVALAELFVFGRRAGHAAAALAQGGDRPALPVDAAAAAVAEVEGLIGARGANRPVALARQLQKVMWEQLGIVRDEAAMQAAVHEIVRLADEAKSLRVAEGRRQNPELLEALELLVMVRTAEMLARSALYRRESRGGHLRTDFPERDDANWLANIVVRRADHGMTLDVVPIAAAP